MFVSGNFFFMLVLFFLMMSFSECHAQNGDAYANAFEQATLCERQQKFAEAAQILESIATDYPNDYTLFLQLGWLYFNAKEYAKAEKQYLRAAALTLDRLATDLGLGWTYYYRQDYEQASHFFHAVLQGNPEQPSAKEGLAWTLLYQSKYDAAGKLFQELLTQKPGDASAKEGLARVSSVLFERQAKFAEAAQTLSSVAAQYPQDASLTLHLGWLYFQAKTYPAAEKYYRQVLTLQPDSQDAQLGLAWSLYYQQKTVAAQKCFATVLALSPQNKSAQEGLASTQSPAPAILHINASLAGGWMGYDDHPAKQDAWFIRGGINATLFEHFMATFSYQSASISGQNGTDDFTDKSLFIAVGITDPAFGALFHYARVDDGSDLLGTTDIYGGTLRLGGRFGDIVAEPSISIYDQPVKINVFRLSMTWCTPVLFDCVRFNLGGAYQNASQKNTRTSQRGEDFWNGSFTMFLLESPDQAKSKWAIWAGGKIGDEFRPAYLGISVVYNILEKIEYGCWVGGQISVTKGVTVSIVFEHSRLKYEDDRTKYTTGTNAITTGISLQF